MPWIESLRGKGSGQLRGQPGFTFTGWNGNVVVSSWLYLQVHILLRPGERTFADVLHAAASPCVVLRQSGEPRGRPRFALYRLRPGLPHTFRMVTVEQHGDRAYLLVTAFPKMSFAEDHYAALPHRVLETCSAYCLRQRDLHPSEPGPRPQRWSPASQVPPTATCCEHRLDCDG